MDDITRDIVIDDLEITRSRGERFIVARALTYGQPYEVTDDGGRSYYREVWRAGVFAKTLNERGARNKIPLLISHNRQGDIPGVVVGAHEDTADAFVFRARLFDDTADGVIDRIEADVLSGISVGARPIKNREFDGGIERVEAALNEISLTSFAQMSDGKVLAMRALVDEQPEAPVITPLLDEYTAYLTTLERP